MRSRIFLAALIVAMEFAASSAQGQGPQGLFAPLPTPPGLRDSPPQGSQRGDRASADELANPSPVDALGSPLPPVPMDLNSSQPFQPPGAPFSQGNRPALGAVRGASSATPNVIGDLFNSGTSSLNFAVRVEAVPFFSGAATYSDLSQLTTGFESSISGLNVTALDQIGDLVNVGDSTSLGLSDIVPIDSVRVQAIGDSQGIADADQFGGTVTAGAPLSNDVIFQAANQAIARELSSQLLSEVRVEELVTLTYLQDESTLTLDGSGEVTTASFIYSIAANIPVPSPGEMVGRYSIADNNSPLPRDRLFLDYNFFHNARITAIGIPVSRWAPGFEKTFCGKMASVEVRLPMAVTLNSKVSTDGEDFASYELGDLAVALKALLFETENFALSCGIAVTVPTADPFSLAMSNQVQAVRIENDSVHLLPYTAFLVRPTERTFLQSFAQFDVDANGNPVFIDEDAFLNQGGSGLQFAGRLHGQTLLRWSSSVGAFVMKRPRGRISNLATVLESHYTATLNRSDRVGSTNLSVGDPNQTLNVINLTAGLHAYVGKSVVTVGYGTPVTSDRVFDGELRVFLNRFF